MLAIAAALTVLAWPIPDQAIFGGVDPSWQVGLQMAFSQGLAFGRDVVFTYGPLGFLVAPRLYGTATWFVSVAAYLAVAFALAYFVIKLLNTRVGLLLSALIALPLVILFNGVLLTGSVPWLPETVFILASIWALSSVLAERRPGVWSTVAWAALGSLVVLIKIDTGIASLFVVGCAIAYCTWRSGGVRPMFERLGVFVGVAIAVIPLTWVVIGQPLSTLPEWVTRSLDIVNGYSSAMNVEAAPTSEYLAAAACFVALFLIVATSELTRARRVASLVLVSVISYIAFRKGFVRHDIHSVEFFAVIAAITLAFIPYLGARRTLTFALAPCVMMMTIGSFGFSQLTGFGGRLTVAGRIVHLAVSPSTRDSFVADSRASLRAGYALPPQVVSELTGHTVDIEPYELMVAWAYPAFRWHQIPVFQTYQANTTSLDNLNAAFLSGPDHPEFVLRQPNLSIDGRLPQFESPKATLALQCHYRSIYANAAWQLFQRTPDRCAASGTSQLRETVHLGENVFVPPTMGDNLVVARFDGIAGSFTEKIKTTVFRGTEFYFSADGGPPYRFLQGTQQSPHLLSAPACATGRPGDLLASSFHWMRITGGGDSQAQYTVQFTRIPYTC